MSNTPYDIYVIAEWCRRNNITYDMTRNGDPNRMQESNFWLYRDGVLLRSFLVDNRNINANDFNHWCNALGFPLP